jgi:hypothetical protein
MVHNGDGLQLETNWSIGKFYDPEGIIEKETKGDPENGIPGISYQEAARRHPELFMGEEKIHGNLATTVGIKALIYWMCNGAGGGAGLPAAPSPANQFNNANAHLVVGTGSGAAAQTDTHSTFTSPVYKAMDSGYPNLSGSTPWIVTWQATFGSGDANQAWNEFGVANGATNPVLFNRVISSKGTKSSGETWVLQMAITFA